MVVFATSATLSIHEVFSPMKAVQNANSATPAVQADVIARGYSGYNTRWAAHILDKIFKRGQTPPDLVTIFFGANDAALPGRLRCAHVQSSAHCRANAVCHNAYLSPALVGSATFETGLK